MATFETNRIPFSYVDNGTTTNTNFFAVFNTENKINSVFQETAVNLVGTVNYSSGSNAIIPTTNTGSNFVPSPVLVQELVNNTQLAQSVQNATINAAQVYLNDGSPVNAQSISQLQVDFLLGTNLAQTQSQESAQQSTTGSTPSTEVNSTPTQSSNPNTIRRSGSASGATYRYPEKASPDEDYVKFEAFEYKPKTLGAALTPPTGGNTGSSLGSVVLPIQSQITDSNTVGWGDGRANAIELEAFRLAQKYITDGLSAGIEAAGKTLDELLKNSTYKEAFQTYAAAQAAQNNDLFLRATGKILNPNLELLFQGPELRTFNFQFQLSPRGPQEAKLVRNIINFFKKHMSVDRSGNDIFLKSPNVFTIKYYKGSSDHKSLNKFKTCALRSFNVDYTPLGSYMTFDDDAGTMVSYGLSMQFQEIDPLFKDDYKNPDEIEF